MKILSVVNQKGGVGKTTTSINLSACLFKMKRRVLLIDLDPQSNATRGSGIEASTIQNSINDVLLDRVNIEKAITKSQFDGYDILPATPSLTESEVALVAREGREFILKNKLSSVLSRYDYILMDCPPSLNILTGTPVLQLSKQFHEDYKMNVNKIASPYFDTSRYIAEVHL